MAGRTLSEGEILGRFLRELGLEEPHPLNLAGNTDDAALLPLAAARCGGRWDHDDCLILTQDGMVEGVHFRLDGYTPEQVAWKCAAANLSDLAAMGGRPLGALVYLGLPARRARAGFVDGLARGLNRSMQRYEYTIFGGDVTASRHLTLSMAFVGKVRRSRALLRGGAGVGDAVFLSACIGLASLGLELVERTQAGDHFAARALKRYSRARERVLSPTPRLDFVELLADRGFASSCIDLSDSLAKSLRLLAEASGAGMEIGLTEKVLHPEVLDYYSGDDDFDVQRLALSAEEDFELLFTVPEELVSSFKREMPPGVIHLGKVVRERGVWSLRGRRRVPVEELGFQHFQR